MERFSIEVSPRKVAAGRDTKMTAAAGPCDITNCNTPPPVPGPQAASKRDPEVRHPQDLSPLS